MKNRYQQIAGTLNYWLFLAVVFMLPFPQIILRYACVIWIISWFFEGRWLRKPCSLRENRTIVPFLLFGFWYLWKIVSVLWIADYAAWAWEMERYMTFGMLVPIGIWGLNNHYKWQQIGKVFIAGCVTAMCVYIALLTCFYYNRELAETLNQYPNWDFTPTTWYAYVSENISNFKHRLFLCSVELIGVVIAFQLYSKKIKILVPLVLIMLSTIPITGSRQSILTCTGLVVVTIIFKLPQVYRIRYGLAILLLGMILGGGLLMLHPRMENFKFSSLTNPQDFSYNEHDTRINIWGLALQHPTDYCWYGKGAGQSTNYMLQQYKDANLSYYLAKEYHSHNQYIEELIEIGLPGMLFFIVIWFAIPIYAYGQGRQTATLFTTLFMMNMLTDCMFGKFCGIALWAFCMIIVLLQSQTTD